MTYVGRWFGGLRLAVIFGVALVSVTGFSQDKPMPDAQIESNVLKSLAGVPELADQAIGTTTVYGTVTLTGSVKDEASRDKAEQAVANTAGVKKVVDELIIGSPVVANTGVSQPDEEVVAQNEQPGNPNQQQSDATMSGEVPQAQQPPMPPAPRGPAPVQRSQVPPAYPQQPRYGYPPSYPPQQPYRVQEAGQAVVVPVGAYIRVRINQAMDSRHTQPGASFDGVVISDVLAGGAVAIPRGALVQGVVADTKPGGDLRGRGGLALELTQVMLEGHSYPLVTEAWSHQGYDKTGQTVGNTVGLAATGAMIGAIAGGGPGALLGAGIGSVVGLGISSASKQGEATVPAEAIVNFRLSQQIALTTVSQAELDRLGAGLPPPNGGEQPQMRRRYYPPPPPPPPYYRPGYYPSPYYYPYYR